VRNPYRVQSKVNPQTSDGFRQIANEVFEALLGTRLSKSEHKIILAIIHKTWGFGKKDDYIPLSQFSKMTGLARRTVCRAIARLEERRIILVERGGGSRASRYMFNKHYDTWLGSKGTPLMGRVQIGTRDKMPPPEGTKCPLQRGQIVPLKRNKKKENHDHEGRVSFDTTPRDKTISAYVKLYTPSRPGKEAPYGEYPSQAILDDIDLLAELWGDDVVQDAIQRAVEAGKTKVGPSYISAILKRWFKEGKIKPLISKREYNHYRETR